MCKNTCFSVPVRAVRYFVSKTGRLTLLNKKPLNEIYKQYYFDTVLKFFCQYLLEFLQRLLSCKIFNNKYIEWKNHPEEMFK